MPETTPPSAPWYKDAVIYQLHVKAFADANGDGIGDFAGLIEKLPYVQDLGATAIWLLPFYPSPLRDDGYDIADYRGVHPAYGTLRDVRDFIREAHRLGLRMITELVVNHTSDQHPWFQRARRAPRGSSTRNFYVWSDTAERYAGTRIIFTDTETVELVVGPGRRPVLLAPLLQPPAGPELRPSAGVRRDRRRDAASGSRSGSTACASTRCRTCANARGPATRTCRRRTRC